jgi:RND superfamily putative drug exporter
MMRLAGFVLRHKLMVTLAWLVIAAAGFATVGRATGALSQSFSIPGQAFRADSTIQRLYHTGGFQNPPVVLTATVPPGSAAGPAAETEAGRLFAAAARAVPGSRLADQATTGDARFSAGRASFALVFTRPGPGGSPAPDPSAAMGRAMSAAAPTGWQAGVTGLAQLEAGTSGGKGTSALAETLLGGLGALLVLAVVFASFNRAGPGGTIGGGPATGLAGVPASGPGPRRAGGNDHLGRSPAARPRDGHRDRCRGGDQHASALGLALRPGEVGY